MQDLIIIGAGPAGFSAAIYAARCKIDVLVIAENIGGTALDAHKVENYPGIFSTTGIAMMEEMKKQVNALNVKIKSALVKTIKKEKDFFSVTTSEDTFKAKKILLATGLRRKKLSIKGEEDFLGKGVSYCATCDTFFFKNKVTAVVGNENHAVNAAILLAENSKKVYVLNDAEKLNAEPILVEQIKKNSKIEILDNVEIAEIIGSKMLEKIKLDNGKEIKLDGLFIELGSTPGAVLAKELGVKLDNQGYIVVDNSQKTNIKGVYAAGDITTNSNKLKQMVCAASEGAVAAMAIYMELKKSEQSY